MQLDYGQIASTSFATLGTYAATTGPGAASIAAFAGGPVGIAVGLGIAGLSVALQEIGKGRREADIITPVQNQYGGVLTAVNQTLSSDPGLTREQLLHLYEIVAAGYAQFDEFTRQAGFTDGRASLQARETIRPLVDGRNNNGDIVPSRNGGTLGTIQRRLDAVGGGGSSFATDSSGNPAAAGGGGAFILGAAVLLAKVLKVF